MSSMLKIVQEVGFPSSADREVPGAAAMFSYNQGNATYLCNFYTKIEKSIDFKREVPDGRVVNSYSASHGN